MTAAIASLLDTIWAEIAGRPCSVSGVAIDPPAVVACEAGPADGRYRDDYPVLAHLDAALDAARAAGFGAVADGFAAVLGDVRWSQNSSYTESNCSKALLDGYAYAALAGPDGPVVQAAPRGGFMLMGPDVTYPAHNHAPREVYWVLTPGAEWSLEKGDWFAVTAGDVIVHEPWMWHGLRTTDAPMLAVAAWLEPGARASIGFAAD